VTAGSRRVIASLVVAAVLSLALPVNDPLIYAACIYCATFVVLEAVAALVATRKAPGGKETPGAGASDQAVTIPPVRPEP
jgi:hypothetical protein